MPYPLGVSFGPTLVTAAQVLDDGTIIPVTKKECSPAYQEFFQQHLEHTVQSNLEELADENCPGRLYPVTNQKTLFTEALESIKKEAEHVLGRPADIQAIATPYQWDGGIRSAVWDAAVAAGSELGGSHMLWKAPHAIFHAYDTPMERPHEYNVLMVDYNKAYLFIAICEVSWGVCAIEGQVRVPDLGEHAVLEYAEVQEGDPVDNAHWSKVRETLNKFVGLAKERLGDYKFITLSGEAEKTMGKMRRLLERFPDSEAKGKLVNNDSIPPLYAAAFGAARAAKAQTDDPKTTRDFLSFPDPIPEEPRSSS